MKRVLFLLMVGVLTTAYVGCEKKAEEDAAKSADSSPAAATTPAETPAAATAEMTTVSLKVPNMT